MKNGYDQLSPGITAGLVVGTLLVIPIFGWLPLVGVATAVVTSAAILDKATRKGK